MVRGIGRRPRTQVVRTARTVGSLPAGIAWDPTHSAPHAAGHYRGDVCPVETQFLVPPNLRGTILKELGHGFWTLRAASPHPFDEVGRARARALGYGVTLVPNGREIDIFDGSSGVCVGCCLGEDANLAAPLAQSLFSRPRERRATEGALPARHGGWGARATRRNSRRNSVHEWPKTAPRGRFADLCTLLRHHGRSRDRAGLRVPRHQRPHGPRDARALGPEAHAARAVTQLPSHTDSRSRYLT